MTETDEETVKHASGLFLAQKIYLRSKIFVQGLGFILTHKENKEMLRFIFKYHLL